MQAPASYDTLVAQIYNAGAGRIPWEAVLYAVNDALKTWAITFTAVDKRTGGILYSHIGGIASPQSQLEYARKWHRIDTRMSMMWSLRVNEWAHCHQHISEAEVAKDPFYQEFLIPMGSRYASGVKLVDDAEMGLVFSCLGVNGSPPLDETALEWMRPLAGHFQQALAIYSHLGNLRMQSSLGQKIMDALPQPVVLLDAGGRMHYANAAGHQALANRRYIFDRAGQLACRRAEDEMALHMALASLALSTPGVAGEERAFVRLTSNGVANPSAPIGVCLSPLRPPDVMGAFGAVPMALLMFYDSTQVANQTPEFFAEVFNLSPAEAQVAVQLTAGLSLKEIAKTRKVALTTVQSQLKSLKEKTAISRQPDLVRKLAAMTALFD